MIIGNIAIKDKNNDHVILNIFSEHNNDNVTISANNSIQVFCDPLFAENTASGYIETMNFSDFISCIEEIDENEWIFSDDLAYIQGIGIQ